MMVTNRKSSRVQTIARAVGLLMALIAPFSVALPARADCFYEGQRYSTGQTVGPYVCMPDGTWQPQ